jgi:uncharacterized RDD family membrane protein YckC
MAFDSIFSGTPAERPFTPWAGFWRRIFAFWIDCFIAAIAGSILWWTLRLIFSSGSVWLSIFVFIALLTCFALFGSNVGHGQTPGQRFVNIQVVDKNGNFLTVKRSLLRYSILLVPLSFGSPGISIGWISIDWLMGLVGFAIFYLYLFNRRTRQSLHDLATGAFVVDAPVNGKVRAQQIWPWHWAIIGGLLLLNLVATNVMAKFWHSGTVPELTSIEQALLDSGRVRVANVTLEQKTVPPRIMTTIHVTVVPKNMPENYETAGAEIAEIVIKADSQAVHRDSITIDFVEDLSFGFAKLWKNELAILRKNGSK